MNGLQLQYTSCRRGLGNGKGFQARAATPGLRPEDIRDVERRSGLQPPRDLPSQPTADEIAASFPRAFRFYPLTSNRLAITRSCYVGQDYSGRYGNFFAHTLVIDGKGLPGWPIDLLEWDGWKGALPPEEDSEDAAPPPLPTVALEDIPAASSFSLDELRLFLQEADGRPALLRQMIRAVLGCRKLSRPVVIRDTHLNGLFWVACVTKALPAAHAAQVTFSTYQFSPRDAVMLNATTTGTDFLCDEQQRRFLLLLFDLVGGKQSEVPAGDELYASTVAEWMAESPEMLAGFHELMAALDHSALDDGLVHGLRLQQILCGEAVPADAVGPALAFAARYARPEERSGIVGRIADTAAVATTGGAEALRAVLEFLVTSAAEGALDRARVPQAWLAALDSALSAERVDAIEELARWTDSLRQRLGSAGAVDPLLLVHETFSRLLDRIRAQTHANLAEFEHLLRFLLGAATRLADPDARTRTVERILNAGANGARRSPEGAAALLRAAGPGLVAEACRHLVAVPVDAVPVEIQRLADLAGDAVRSYLASLPESERAAARRTLDCPATWPVLLGEWRALLRQAPEATAFFRRYRTTTLTHMPAFAAAHRDDLLRNVANVLPSPARERQALEWITSEEVRTMGRGMQQWCVLAAAQGISLRGADSDAAAAALLAQWAKHLAIRLEPDRPALRELLAAAADAGASLTGLLKMQERMFEPTLAAHLVHLPAEDYLAFADSYLAPVLARATTAAHHGQVLSELVTEAHAKEHDTACLTALASPLLRPRQEALQAAFTHWLGQAEPSPLRERALRTLGGQLTALSRAAFEGLAAAMNVDRLAPKVRADWELLRDAAARQHGSTWRRLAGLFRGRKEP